MRNSFKALIGAGTLMLSSLCFATSPITFAKVIDEVSLEPIEPATEFEGPQIALCFQIDNEQKTVQNDHLYLNVYKVNNENGNERLMLKQYFQAFPDQAFFATNYLDFSFFGYGTFKIEYTNEDNSLIYSSGVVTLKDFADPADYETKIVDKKVQVTALTLAELFAKYKQMAHPK